MDQHHTPDMEPFTSPPSVFQSQSEPDTLSLLLARTAIFIFLFGLVCFLFNVDRSTLSTILVGVALVFVILSLKKIIKGNWCQRRTRRGSSVRIRVPAHQWRRIFRGESPFQNDQDQLTSFACLDNLMQLSEGLYPSVTPVPALLPPPTYEQAVAETDQPQAENETMLGENDTEQREVQSSNRDAEGDHWSVAIGTNAEDV